MDEIVGQQQHRHRDLRHHLPLHLAGAGDICQPRSSTTSLSKQILDTYPLLSCVLAPCNDRYNRRQRRRQQISEWLQSSVVASPLPSPNLTHVIATAATANVDVASRFVYLDGRVSIRRPNRDPKQYQSDNQLAPPTRYAAWHVRSLRERAMAHLEHSIANQRIAARQRRRLRMLRRYNISTSILPSHATTVSACSSSSVVNDGRSVIPPRIDVSSYSKPLSPSLSANVVLRSCHRCESSHGKATAHDSGVICRHNHIQSSPSSPTSTATAAAEALTPSSSSNSLLSAAASQPSSPSPPATIGRSGSSSSMKSNDIDACTRMIPSSSSYEYIGNASPAHNTKEPLPWSAITSKVANGGSIDQVCHTHYNSRYVWNLSWLAMCNRYLSLPSYWLQALIHGCVRQESCNSGNTNSGIHGSHPTGHGHGVNTASTASPGSVYVTLIARRATDRPNMFPTSTGMSVCLAPTLDNNHTVSVYL
jgi:hypothetical protein